MCIQFFVVARRGERPIITIPILYNINSYRLDVNASNARGDSRMGSCSREKLHFTVYWTQTNSLIFTQREKRGKGGLQKSPCRVKVARLPREKRNFCILRIIISLCLLCSVYMFLYIFSGQPVTVGVSMYLLSISSVSEVKMVLLLYLPFFVFRFLKWTLKKNIQLILSGLAKHTITTSETTWLITCLLTMYIFYTSPMRALLKEFLSKEVLKIKCHNGDVSPFWHYRVLTCRHQPSIFLKATALQELHTCYTQDSTKAKNALLLKFKKFHKLDCYSAPELHNCTSWIRQAF